MKLRFEFLILEESMPSTRFRVMPYLPILAARGVACSVFSMAPSGWLSGLKRVAKMWHYLRAFFIAWRSDMVFLQKPGFVINRWLYLYVLFGLQRKVIFDFDDAVFVDLETGEPHSAKYLKKLTYIMTRSRSVIAGNPYLAEFARKYNTRVNVIPTAIDCDAYRPRPDPLPRRSLTIGWMGTASNLPYLFMLIPVLKRLLAELDVRIMIVSNGQKKPEQLCFSERVEWKAWRAESEIDDLRFFDIGIMPLADNPFTRGKCAFKLLQYMAVAVPAVASPVGVNRRIVVDGVNGFLATDENEWLEKLRALCADESLRRELGAAGRKTVVNDYALKKISTQWVSLLLRTAEEGD